MRELRRWIPESGFPMPERGTGDRKDPSEPKCRLRRSLGLQDLLSGLRYPLSGLWFPVCAIRHPLCIDTLARDAEILAVSTEASREKFKAFLADKGLRVTNQRVAIFDAAFARTTISRPKNCCASPARLDESVSRATVYRTLPIMTESAILREIDIGKNLKYYAPCRDNRSQQAQVICLDCRQDLRDQRPVHEWYAARSRPSSV